MSSPSSSPSTASSPSSTILPFGARISHDFWHALATLKLDTLKLSEAPVSIYGTYEAGARYTPGRPARLDLALGTPPPNVCALTGNLYVVNVGDHLATRKIELARDSQDTDLLVICHADLKKYVFTYYVRYACRSRLASYSRIEPPDATFSTLASQLAASPGTPHILADPSDHAIAFIDPTNGPSPGWPLHKAISLAPTESTTVDVVGYRGRRFPPVVLRVALQEATRIEVWEKDGSPTTIDLGSSMDPGILSSQARDLNLKLMRWRVAPSLDLASLSSTRCLVLGAGTLGCYVGRLLVAWGVNAMTFVDSGRVSFSNPSRQPLFTAADAAATTTSARGLPKAQAAADNLRAVVPTLKTQAHHLEIPMSGHSDAKLTVLDALDALVADHDALFILTDSRESRWLPTVLATRHNVPCFNAAIGFESFVALRHGGVGGEEVGCYFCNDVVAPMDSSKGRSLDEMCTVTRPGMACLASAHLVELFARAIGNLESPPHTTVRGTLTSIVTASPQKLAQCTACAPDIAALDNHELIRCVRTPSLAESISGLARLREAVDKMNDFWEDEEEEVL
ncbi:Autophagy protein 7 [Savitreella phatthalungensis]